MNKFQLLEKDCMLKVCLQNVNNQRIDSCIICVHSSTTNKTNVTNTYSTCEQPTNYKQSIPILSTLLFTPITLILCLLNKSFTHYPQHLLLKQLI